jgi:hypothetical protein
VGMACEMLARHTMIVSAVLMSVHSAYAHGIAGNRFFVGTVCTENSNTHVVMVKPAEDRI